MGELPPQLVLRSLASVVFVCLVIKFLPAAQESSTREYVSAVFKLQQVPQAVQLVTVGSKLMGKNRTKRSVRAQLQDILAGEASRLRTPGNTL